jgi:hypothetical protein
MSNLLDTLKQYGGLLSRGLMIQLAPGIAEGLINELFHQWNVDRAKAIQDIQNNRSLWATMKPEERKQLRALAKTIGNLDFITPDLVISSIKKDFHSVASLFLNWPEAGDWLTRQIEELKREANTDME